MPKNGLLQQAYTALKGGRKQEARQLLTQLVQQHPEEFRGWLWLASVAESPQQALTYVERAAQLNPTHPSVAQARAWAERRVDSIQGSVGSSSGGGRQDEEGEKRPFLPLIWAGAAALILVLLLAGAWLINNNGWANLDQTAHTQPADASARLITDSEPGPLDDTAVIATLEPTSEPTPTTTPPAPRSLLQAKSVAAVNQPLPTWTTTPTASPTPTATPTPEPTFVASQNYIQRPLGVRADERWIDINLTTQTLTAYEGDTPVFSTLISSGISSRRTVTGQFRVWHRTLSQTMDGGRFGYDYYLENVPHVMYFYRDFAIHGAYWHNNFGTPMSSGCVNMKVDEAEWLFNWSQMGTLVNVRY